MLTMHGIAGIRADEATDRRQRDESTDPLPRQPAQVTIMTQGHGAMRHRVLPYPALRATLAASPYNPLEPTLAPRD